METHLPSAAFPFPLLLIDAADKVLQRFTRNHASAVRSHLFWHCELKVQLQPWASTHSHPNTDGTLIWHWIITAPDPADLFRPIKLLICMLTTEPPLRYPPTHHHVTGAQWDARRWNTNASLHRGLCLSSRMECRGVYQVERSTRQYGSEKHTRLSHAAASRAGRRAAINTHGDCSVRPSAQAESCQESHLWKTSSLCCAWRGAGLWFWKLSLQLSLHH